MDHSGTSGVDADALDASRRRGRKGAGAGWALHASLKAGPDAPSSRRIRWQGAKARDSGVIRFP